MLSIVTGGAGFIGSHLIDRLISEGHEVICIDDLSNGKIMNLKESSSSNRLTFLKSSINASSLYDDLRRIIDIKNVSGKIYLFHLAGKGDIVPSIENPTEYVNTNINGTVNILEIARKLRISKMVYAASSSCYGLAECPTSEIHKIQLEHPYAATKYLGEQLVFHWAKVYGIQANSVCIFNAYGPRSMTSGSYGAVFGVFLKQKLKGMPFTIVGDGQQTRDFIYVSDVVNAFLKASTIDQSEQRYNIGASRPVSINYLADLMDPVGIEYIPWRPGEPKCTYADTSKAQRDLGWKPQVSFEEGVKRLLNRIDEWAEAPLWDVESIRDATRTWFKYLK